MPRNSSGFPRPSSRSSLTRRGLIGAAVVVASGVLADMVRGPRRRAVAATSDRPRKTPQRTLTTTNQAGSVAPGSRGSTSKSPPSHHGLPHGHGDAPAHHAGQGHAHHGSHGHAGHNRRQEHVTLPPATVRVRHHPIYQVDQLIHHAPKNAIGLTIDDGPDPEWTPKVLRLLDKHHMQASFCVVGIHADAYPRLVHDIHKAGHVIVNHSYTHIQPFARQTEKRIVAEITRTQRAIEKATKVTPELFRSPGGDWSPFVYRAIAAYGLIPLDWDVDPEDWARPGKIKIEHRMLRGRPGDIVLCHDGGGDRIETVRALRKVLPTWRRRGYTTIPLVVPAKDRPH
jgi:peptidoglycan/xylan/chitin deacetylase (PgdA/CDA1 family)